MGKLLNKKKKSTKKVDGDARSEENKMAGSGNTYPNYWPEFGYTAQRFTIGSDSIEHTNLPQPEPGPEEDAEAHVEEESILDMLTDNTVISKESDTSGPRYEWSLQEPSGSFKEVTDEETGESGIEFVPSEKKEETSEPGIIEALDSVEKMQNEIKARAARRRKSPSSKPSKVTSKTNKSSTNKYLNNDFYKEHLPDCKIVEEKNSDYSTVYYFNIMGVNMTLVDIHTCNFEIKIIPNFEDIFRVYGVENCTMILDFLIKNINTMFKPLIDIYYRDIMFLQLSISNRYKPLVDLLYKRAHSVSDFEPQYGSNQREYAIFIVGVDRYNK